MNNFEKIVTVGFRVFAAFAAGYFVRSMVHEIMSPFYIELESFGFYMNNSGLTRLVSDEY